MSKDMSGTHLDDTQRYGAGCPGSAESNLLGSLMRPQTCHVTPSE